MMFRKLYWVSEEIDGNGQSNVVGVYTSIPDLLRYGIPSAHGKGLRLTLTKLDSEHAPLGRWSSPNFEGLEQSLQEFVATEEFSREQTDALVKRLVGPVHAMA